MYPFKEFKLLDISFDVVIDIGFGGLSIPTFSRDISRHTIFKLDARAKKVNVVNEIAKLMNIRNFKVFMLEWKTFI